MVFAVRELALSHYCETCALKQAARDAADGGKSNSIRGSSFSFPCAQCERGAVGFMVHLQAVYSDLLPAQQSQYCHF